MSQVEEKWYKIVKKKEEKQLKKKEGEKEKSWTTWVSVTNWSNTWIFP